MSTVLLTYSQLPDARRPRGPVARTLIWLMQSVAWIALGAAMVGGTSYAIASTAGLDFIGPFVSIGTLLFSIAAATLARGVRRVRDLVVLHYLEHAVRLGAPLASMIRAAEQSETGGVRTRLRRLSEKLQDGHPVADALSFAAPSLPRRIIGLVAGGEKTGRLAASLRRILGRRDLFPAGNPTHAIFYRWYPLMMLAFCFAAVQVVLIFVMPKLDQLGRDFNLPDRPAMRWVEQFSATFGIALLIVSGVVLLVFCGRMASTLFTPRGLHSGPLRAPFERLIWLTPFAGGIVRSRALADACHIVAEAIDAGCEPAQAIAEAGAAAPSSIMSRRLKGWAARLSASGNMSASARAARLPRLLCAMLATSGGTEDLPDIFRFFRRYYDGRFGRAVALLRGAMIPGIVLFFGILVAAIAMNVFQPLVEVMNKLTGR